MDRLVLYRKKNYLFGDYFFLIILFGYNIYTDKCIYINTLYETNMVSLYRIVHVFSWFVAFSLYSDFSIPYSLYTYVIFTGVNRLNS